MEATCSSEKSADFQRTTHITYERTIHRHNVFRQAKHKDYFLIYSIISHMISFCRIFQLKFPVFFLKAMRSSYLSI
jgi:hypothetical protein